VKGLFVDTAGWMACAGQSRSWAPSTDRVARRGARKRVRARDHDYVIDETLTLLRVRLRLAAAEAWWAQIEGSSRLRWEWIGMGSRGKGAQRLLSSPGQELFLYGLHKFRRNEGAQLKQALTTDRHFRQMGFEVLPASSGR
jgi:predicted nucleic acid-binding protein